MHNFIVLLTLSNATNGEREYEEKETGDKRG